MGKMEYFVECKPPSVSASRLMEAAAFSLISKGLGLDFVTSTPAGPLIGPFSSVDR
jgi:hypothetical protein